MCPRLLVFLALALAAAHAQTNEVLVNTTYGCAPARRASALL